MSYFKDLVTKDLDIFFNPDEFGEVHKLDGQEMIVVITTDSHGSASLVSDKDLSQSGIHGADFYLYVKKKDCPIKFSAGKILNLDGKETQILKVAEETEVLILTLKQFRRF